MAAVTCLSHTSSDKPLGNPVGVSDGLFFPGCLLIGTALAMYLLFVDQSFL